MTPDAELLSRYLLHRDEAAFADLVKRHLDHVYSTALRLVAGDSHLAEDITQRVFANLAGQAETLRSYPVLSGWLHTSARFEAAKAVRTEQRRRVREQIALDMETLHPSDDSGWEEIRPVLDEAIGELSDVDRDALLLRFFEKKSLTEVGLSLGLTENTARMRVTRALERLRERLSARGITSTAAIVTAALTDQAVTAAPSALHGAVIKTVGVIPIIASQGIATSTWSSFTSTFLKFSAAVLVIVAVGIGLLMSRPGSADGRAASITNAAVAVQMQTNVPVAKASFMSKPSRLTEPAGDSEKTGLKLTFVDAETGVAIARQTIGLRGWAPGTNVLVEKMVKLDAEGSCYPPFDPNYSFAFWILTRVEGYADTRLRWTPKKGDTIPDAYTVRLIRPVKIGGIVVDHLGSPVEGATVRFGGGPREKADAVEDHGLDSIAVKSDVSGRWEINRIAPETIGFIGGSVTHPLHASAPRMDLSRQPELLPQLRQETHVSRFKEGVVVRGIVVDPNGNPVGRAHVQVGRLGGGSGRETTCNDDGTFEVMGCEPGESPITATAKGFAPAAIQEKLVPGLKPLRLALQSGATLRLRVVDKAGNPVAKARVGLELPHTPDAPQIEFNRNTDEAGRLIWTEAPDQNLRIFIYAKGYIQINDLPVRPGEKEHLITVSQRLVLKGSVRDAVSGDPVPRFTLGIGCGSRNMTGAVEPHWFDIDRFWVRLSGQEFQQVLTEPAVAGDANGFFFRFDADGYEPQVTRHVRQEEGEVRFDIKLRPIKPHVLMVYAPDGKAAGGAEACMFGAGFDLTLSPKGFRDQMGGISSRTFRTKTDGWLEVPATEEGAKLAILHPTGILVLDAHTARESQSVRLQPWSRLEGHWRRAGVPAANQELHLAWVDILNQGLKLDYQSYRIQTDEHGHFVVPQIPAGTFHVMFPTGGGGFGGFSSSSGALNSGIQVGPGETKEVILDDSAASLPTKRE